MIIMTPAALKLACADALSQRYELPKALYAALSRIQRVPAYRKASLTAAACLTTEARRRYVQTAGVSELSTDYVRHWLTSVPAGGAARYELFLTEHVEEWLREATRHGANSYEDFYEQEWPRCNKCAHGAGAGRMCDRRCANMLNEMDERWRQRRRDWQVSFAAYWDDFARTHPLADTEWLRVHAAAGTSYALLHPPAQADRGLL